MKTPENKKEKSLPNFLKKYHDRVLGIQLKARFLYYLFWISISAITASVCVTFFTKIIQPGAGAVDYYKLFAELTIIALFALYMQILRKGYLLWAANFLVISLQLLVWFTLFFRVKASYPSFGAVAYLLASFSAIPIIMEKKRRTIFIFMIVNIIGILITAYYFRSSGALTTTRTLEYMAANTIAIIFMTLVSYNIFRINMASLNKAVAEYNQRTIAEEALVVSERRYRELSDLLPQCVFEVSLDGSLRYINKKGLEMFGYTKEELQPGVNTINGIAAKDKKLFQNQVTDFIRTGRNSGIRYTALRKDGTTFPIRFYASLIRDNEKPTGIRGVGIDITAETEADESIKRNLQLFRTIVEFSPSAFFMSNHQGHILMINKAFSAVTGYTYADITKDDGIRVSALLHGEKASLIKIMLEESGQAENIEIKTTNSKGSTLELLYYAKKLKIHDKEVILHSFFDMTQKKKIEKELEFYSEQLEKLVIERTNELANSNEELIKANEVLSRQRKELENTLNELQNKEKQLFLAEKMASLGMLSAGIAHEINNPLNFIKGGIYGLENFFLDNVPAEKHEEALPLILAIDRGIDRAADIVRSLNRFSRQTENKTEACNLHNIIKDCLILIENQVRNRIQTELQLNATRHTLIYNEGRVNQVILNLLTNAEQAIKEKGNIVIKTENQNNLLILQIIDDGTGINQEDMLHVFDPFFTTKEPGEGTGLGLSITYQIVEEIGGKIEYQSEPGKGTTATVTIPLKEKQGNDQ